MFVSWGMGTNSCQVDNRKPGSPGMNPCPYLVDHGGIWKFDENKLQQKQSDGTRYATGMRSIVGMSWDKGSDALYAVHHGRDDLRLLWPQYYNPWQSAMLPSDEFFKVSEGFDGGFPYYYYDQMLEKKMLSPEYGGDGKKEGDGAKLTKPLVGFPGHFAPNDVLFYKGDQFPARYKEGAFISLHGSTNRIPYPQVGNVVVFVPMKNGKVTGPWEVFADGFAGKDTLAVANDATYRPMGLTEGPDGSLYVGETQKGKIWRIMYKGDKKSFGNKELAVMEKRKALPHLKTPDEMADNLDRIGKPVHAELLYNIYCRNCHQNDGNGDGSRFPPLAESEWVNSDKAVLINVVLNGLTGAITVKGQNYNEAMPAHASFLTDKEISEILTYVRRSWGNKSGPISEKEVADVRKLMSRK
jgi:mono/diheme cytochrome c family protein